MYMSAAEPTIGDIKHSIRHAVRLHWGLFLAQGLIMIVLGVFAVVWPQISTVAVDVYVGWLFFVSGVVGLALMFFSPSVSSFLWALLTAALALLVGILLLWHPIEGAVSLTLVLIAFFIVEGVFQIAGSIAYRSLFPESWGWMLLSGLADLALAAVIIAGWPGTASWALGLIVGVNLISSGFAITMVATTARRAVKMVEKVTR
jgi:uncharacterized membrane protein HdeD (DUF308 family)